MAETIVIAIGGNSLIRDPEHVSVPSQYEAVRQTAEHLVGLIEQGHRIVIVHGNGPQVGFILRRAELAKHELHSVPLDSCVADTQGALGYNIQMALKNEMLKKNLSVPSATIVTQVVVDKNDPSFQNPTKPIGSFMKEAEAQHHAGQDGWHITEDAGRGFRRVVPSPKPIKIVELETIRRLLEQNTIVVAAGGGGIPVIEDENGMIQGIEAVIDKDYAASLLAGGICADRFVISTAVEQVCLHYGKPDEKRLDVLTVADAEKYIDQGHFAPGSMLPKIKAMTDYIKATGKSGLITDPANLHLALQGKAGTRFVP